ncbi:hypothetical protein SNEBB_000533 [Seison nebaliae]|nr:hypothetical protein SNEBB_000533 [Seison nebaliae]
MLKTVKRSVDYTSTPTIPTKYRTIVLKNSCPKGFNQTDSRFHLKFSSNPGPGSYNLENGESTSNQKTFSGPFASRVSRKNAFTLTDVKKRNEPGPGTYSPKLELVKESNKNSAAFLAKERTSSSKRLLENPGPNNYKVEKVKVDKYKFRSNNMNGKSCFKSTAPRIYIEKVDEVPPPGQYNLSKKPEKHVISSSFKSKREISLSKNVKNPGPSDYHPYEMTSVDLAPKTQQPLRHQLRIAAPALVRKDSLQLPGPGSYNVDLRPDDRYVNQTSTFVSGTSRWKINDNEMTIQPAPNTYNPQEVGKQSFHLNMKNRWI